MHLVLPPSAAPPSRPIFESSTPPANLRSSIFPTQTGQPDSGLRLRRPHGDAPVENLRAYLQTRRAETRNPSTTQTQAASATDTGHSNTAASILAQAQANRREFSERLRSMTQEVATATRAPDMSVNTDDRSTTSAGAYFLYPSREPVSPINPNRDRLFGMNAQPNQSAESSHRQTLASILQRLVSMETQLSGHIPPSVDDISRVRLQLHQLLDEQYRNPLAPREVGLESWLARLSTIAIRADQLRIDLAQTRSGATQRATPTTTGSSVSHSQMYMISSPEGHYGVAISPAVLSGIPNPAVTAVANSTAGQINAGSRVRTAVQPVFRAGERTTRRHRRRFVTALNVFRLTRAVWVFIRLFVICYLVTSHGTWLRLLSFFFAAFIAAISQTRWPRRARRAIWDPIQRHLENLVPMDDPRAQRLRPRRGVGQPDASARPTPTPAPDVEAEIAEPTVLGNVRHVLVRAERGVALFLATLVPGIGERYVAARNAADRAREEAERQREQEENELRQQQENSETGNTVESEGANSSGASPAENSSSAQSSDSSVQPPDETGGQQQPMVHAQA